MRSDSACVMGLRAILVTVLAFSAIHGTEPGIDKAEYYASRGPVEGVSCETDSIVEPVIDWPVRIGVQQTGVINASFTCRGTFGSSFGGGTIPPGWPVASFETPAFGGMEYLWGGAIWFGGIVGEDTLVSVGMDSWSGVLEMFPPDPEGSIRPIDCPTDYSMRAEFTDTVTAGVLPDYSGRPHIPMNLRIANRSHVWRMSPYDNCVIYDMVVTNIGEDTIREGFVGIYIDSDVKLASSYYGFDDDLTGSLRDQGIAYTIDNDGDAIGGQYPADSATPKVFALAYLGASFEAVDTNFNWWSQNTNPDLDFGPRLRGTAEDPFRDFGTGGLGTPEGDANKYYMLSHSEWDYDQCYTYQVANEPIDTTWMAVDPGFADGMADGWDTRFLLSIGSFDLVPDSSVRIIYTTFTADSIHIDPENFQDNLPEWPYAYLAGLGLGGLSENFDAAAGIADTLFDPKAPPIGFKPVYSSVDSVVLEWDPYVFEGVVDYEIRLTEIDQGTFPYPGVIPPWLFPTTPVMSVYTDHSYRHVLDDLDPNGVYVARLFHRTDDLRQVIGADIGLPSDPLHIHTAPRPAAPSMPAFYCVVPDSTVSLEWVVADGQEVDHYNIYRFAENDVAQERFLAYYDTSAVSAPISPIDTFHIEETTYYYHSLEPYQVVDGSVTSLTDLPDDGCVYVVTAVDSYGFESEMTCETTVWVVPNPSRELLVVTNSHVLAASMTPYDSVAQFYETVLGGMDYEIFNVADSCPMEAFCRPGLFDLAVFRTVLIDDGMFDNLPQAEREAADLVFSRYLMAGGRLVYCGAFSSYYHFGNNTPPTWRGVTDPFIDSFFGIDSVFYAGYAYYLLNRLPLVDSLFGFNRAEEVFAGMPDLECDTLRYPMGTSWSHFWPTNTPPCVAAFGVSDRGVATHLYRSLWPGSSMVEGATVGVQTVGEGWETYLFGFHLYYMEEDQARELILAILGEPTGIDDTSDKTLPTSYSLSQNYPNPFNPDTRIDFSLPKSSEVEITVYNVLGQAIRELVSGPLPAGEHSVEWDGTDGRGRAVASGVYFYRLRAEDVSIGRKMLLVK